VRLLDRIDEREALDHVLTSARDGLSGVLVVRGDPGVGKTSLLEYAASAAAGFRVARVRGVESEMDLAFAGVHRLLVPFLPRVAELPPPQRDAMEAAFGLARSAPPDRFRVGLATLSLLADAAVDRPLLCVVDDAQWLDQESLAALGLVGRRLFADRIALVFGIRLAADDGGALAGIPDVVVGGLPDDAAAELLRLTVGGVVDGEVARRIMEETRGSPLGIVELVAGLTASQLSGREVPPDPLPLSGRLEAHFLRQVGGLGAATQAWMLTAAAEPSGDVRVVDAAARRLGCSPRTPCPPSPRACSCEIPSPGSVTLSSGRRCTGAPPRRTAGAPTRRWRRSRTRCATPTAVPGTSPPPRSVGTRPSPPSSSGPPIVGASGAATPPPGCSWPGPPS
jgi:hypothetical protein